MNAFDTLVLLETPNIGRKTVKKILDMTSDLQFFESKDYIEAISHISPKIASSISIFDIEDAKRKTERIIEKSEKQNILTIGFNDERYPESLKYLGIDAPVVLFVKGDITVLNSKKKVAIIGTRNNSPNGKSAGEYITKQFVSKGYVIVSGLALGCDTIGHTACLDAGGKTIAVMAGGLDNIYPKENMQLSKNIANNGCLISEYPIGKSSLPSFFVERDRIQSGLSSGVVVIETDIKGGTMHTVRFSKEQGRSLACINYKNGTNLSSNAGNRMLISSGEAFPLSSDNIEEYINTFKSFSSSHIFNKNEVSPKSKPEWKIKENVQNSDLKKSIILNSDPDKLKLKEENVKKISVINKKIEHLKKEIKKFGGDNLSQTAIFDMPENKFIKEIEFLKLEINRLSIDKKQLVEENKQLLESMKK